MASYFVDANTIISGLLYPGHESHLLELGRRRVCVLVANGFVLEEVQNYLRRKKPLSAARHASALRLLARAVTVLPDPPEEALRRARDRVPDPADAAVLAGFETSGCDLLVTGDLRLRRVIPGSISTKKAVRQIMKGTRPGGDTV